MKFSLRPLLLIFCALFASSSASYAVTPSILQSASASGTNASITVTLPAAPAVGHMVYVLFGSGVYSTRTIAAPDSSWTCTSAAQYNVLLETCSHIVLSGDGPAFTFTPTSTNGPAISGIIFEAANTVSAQTVYNYSGPDQGNVQQTTSPAVVPAVIGTLPVAAIFNGQASAASAGFTSMQINGKLGAFMQPALTLDTTTPIATTFTIPGYNSGSSLQAMLLLAPGVLATAPSAAPVAGSYPTAQSVSLSDSQAGTVVHYTMDGSAPTCDSPAYASALSILSTATVNYVACASGYGNSAIMSATYTIGAGTLSGIELGPLADLHGYTPFAGDAFHQAITAGTVDPNSAAIVAGLGSGHLHHDWSSVAGGNYGIPYTVVDSSVTPLVPFNNLYYSDESDLSLYPIPVGLPIESFPNACQTTGDNHAIILDKATGVAYELYQAQYCPTQTPQFSASNGVIWDMTTNEHRPYGYTSVDAAGLSVFEGLVRYDEVASGVINHAIRFTVAATRCDHYYYGSGVGAFVPPATHAACTGGGNLNIIGMRIRLKASFDISGYSPANQVILQAMKTYGMILADNGSSMYFQGTPDARWNDNDLVALDQVQTSNFEVMTIPTVETSYSHPTGDAPVINSFAPAQSSIALGQSVDLVASVTGASYMYVDKAGFFRGSTITVTPTATTTYLLTTRNAYGETTASATVVVGAAAPAGISTAANLAFNTVPDQTYGVAPFALSASTLSTAPVTYSVKAGPASVSGSMVTVTGIGTVTLAAQQAATNSYAAANAITSFAVNGAIPTLTLKSIADLSFGSPAFTVSATSTSSGAITYSVLSGPATIAGDLLTPTAAGLVTIQATQAASGNYAMTTASTSFNVTGITPTLAMVPIAGKTATDAAFSVSSTSNSSGTSSYSVTGPASILGNVVTLAGSTGTVTVTVQQAASGNYIAGTASTSFSVTAPATVSPRLAINPIPAQVYGAPPFTVSVTSLSSGSTYYAVTSGPATVNGNVVTLTGMGAVTLSASQAASGTYAASTASQSFNVTGITPTLAMNPIANKTTDAGAFAVSFTSNSSGAAGYSVTGPATVLGNIVTLTGSAGTVTVTVQQAASGSYTAGTASTSFSVTAPAANPVGVSIGVNARLTINSIPTQVYGDDPFTVSVISLSSGRTTYEILAGPARVSGNVVTLTGTGTVTLAAIQAASGKYSSGYVITTFEVVAPNISVLLKLSTTTAAAGTPIQYVVVLASNVPSPLNGTVTILDNDEVMLKVDPISTTIGSHSAGAASGKLKKLDAGTHVISANYTEKKNSSFSAPITVVIH